MSAAPALLGHCQAVYEKMVERAFPDAQGNLYFEGSGTKIVQEAGLSNPYYSSVFGALQKMDCVRQGRRGGGGMGSIWYLLQAPSEELWSAHMADGVGGKGKSPKVSLEEVMQAQKGLLKQVASLEQRVALLEARDA